LRAVMKDGTSFSLTSATTQPPHPAPVKRAPNAPLRRHMSTRFSSSGQLKKKKQTNQKPEHKLNKLFRSNFTT
jgi:hypothetical protein